MMYGKLPHVSNTTEMSTRSDFQIGDAVYVDELKILCNIEKELGSGTQGKVYSLISPDNSQFALKWYFPSMATRGQFEILESLIQKKSPSDKFLWPLALIKTDEKNGFGYIMSLKPSRFKSFSLWLSRKVNPSFRVLLTACFELAQSFHLLHSKGLCYQDLSLNNIYFDPSNGEIRIGDTDNIVINGDDKGNVIGTPKFMAPEIIIGNSLPNTQSDLYSLAIILFYILFLNHPLEGKIESSIKSLDLPSMSRLYGFEPLFIFDPFDSSNYPDPIYHSNAIIFWNIYPEYFKNMFVRAFTNGIKDPVHGRVRETEWQIALLSLRDSIYYCRHCGSENFFTPPSTKFRKIDRHHGNETSYDSDGYAINLSYIARDNQSVSICWNENCKSMNSKILNMQIDKRLCVVLNHNTQLFAHHIDSNRRYDFSNPLAEVTRHPNNPDIWGLKNISNNIWKVKKIDGYEIELHPKKSVLLVPETMINFGNSKGVICY